MTKQALIIGGTGQIGRAVGLKLLKEGWSVTFASRIGNIPDSALGFGAKAISLDRDQPGALALAIGGGGGRCDRYRGVRRNARKSTARHRGVRWAVRGDLVI